MASIKTSTYRNALFGDRRVKFGTLAAGANGDVVTGLTHVDFAAATNAKQITESDGTLTITRTDSSANAGFWIAIGR